MTYNFDPDRWYENERAALDSCYRAGGIDAPRYQEALRELDRRYEDMLKRLDGTYHLPESES